jgi:hypothetical protein
MTASDDLFDDNETAASPRRQSCSTSESRNWDFGARPASKGILIVTRSLLDQALLGALDHVPWLVNHVARNKWVTVSEFQQGPNP